MHSATWLFKWCNIDNVVKCLDFSFLHCTGGICLLRKGELIPRNKIIIPVASSISTSKCVQKCKQQKATNNNLINGFTTNHLTTSTICWCNIGAKYRRNYQSCSIGPLAGTSFATLE